MAKKKQRINLIDRNGNSQVVQVNSSDLSDSTKNAKKSTIKKAISGGASEARNYAPLVKAANTVTGGTAGLFLNKDKQGHSLVDNTIQLGKNLASGTFSGLTSIPDSELYEVRNSLEKGEKKAEETTGVRDTLKSLFGTGKDALLSSNPITAQFVKNDDDSKGVEGALKGLKNVSDIGGGKKGLYKSIEAFGEAYSDYKKAKGQEGNLSKKVEKLQEKIDKPSEEYAQKVQEENQNYSKPVQVLGENFQTVGNMVPSIAMSAVTKNPSAGMWALYQGAKGSSTKEALQKGADLDTATAIGNAKGLLEVGTEQLSGGIKFKGKSVYGQGALDDVIENNVNRLVKNKAANWLVKQFGTAPLGEIAEETISDLAGHFIDKNTVDPNAKYTAKDWLHTAGMTYLSTLTLNLLGGSFGKSSYNQNLQSMAETQVADIQNRVDRGLMSQEDGARTIEQITQELNDSIGTNEEISTPEEIQEALANTSSEDIQQAVASATNAITNQIEQGKLNEQQGQQLLETIQENAQDMLEQQQKLTQNQNGQMQFNLDNQSTIEDKIFLVQSLNDTERAALTEITQKLKRGEQLNEQDRATLQYLNSKGTPQAAENTPIQNEVAQPSAIPQETQNVAQNDKNDVLELGETNAKSYGDLGKGRDTNYLNMSNSRRSTGHFGTGTYFVDENYEPGETSSYNKRPVSRANLSDYNLFKPSNENDGLDLHDALKEINYNNTRINDELYNQLNPYYEASFGTTNNLLDEESFNDYKNIRKLLEDAGVETDDFDGSNYSEYERYLEDKITDVLNNYDHNIRAEKDLKRILNITDEQYNNAIEKVKEAQKEYDKHDIDQQVKDDSLSTVFMKALGYEGIDVRHLDRLNNTTYGTVVYDMKNNEKEKNKLNRMQEKININTIKSTIAPYYDTPLTKENYNEIKDAVDTTFRETANNLVTLLGGKIKDTTNNIGGFTFSEGENAGNWVKELSYTFELENMSKEDGMLFSSLMGDLAYEQQEAVISSTYENDLNNSNALEFRLKYQDIDKLMDALDKLGIHDYTIDTNNKTLNLLEFDLEKPYDTVQKITDIVQELGGNEADAKFTGIQSEYIDKDVRKGIYETWLKANEGRKENRELYSLVKEAYKKIGGTSDSSFSNENALANRDNNAIDKQGNPVMAPFLQNNGGNGGNGGGNNNTTALGKQPEPKKGSVEADILRSYDERIANKKKPFKEKIDTVMHETTRALFDKGEEIYRIGKGHNDAELYPLYDLAQTSKASADFSINADQTNLKGEKVGESLNKVWEEVEKKNLVYEMNKYLYEQHNLDRWNQLNEDGSRKYVFGPEHSDIVSKKNIADLLRLHPELEELSKPILQYQKNLKQLLVDSGLQSQSQSDKLDSIYKNYVPTWRDKDNTGIKAMSNYGGNVTVNNQIKAAKGSSENLLPLKEVQAQMTENIFKAARMNVFLQQLYKDIGDINELKKIGMNSLKSDTNIEPIDADAFYKAAEEHLDEYLKNYAPNNAKVDKVNGQPVATVWFNGHKVTMPIDKGIQTALEPVTVDGSVAKILETINNFKRGVITEYNPIFAITNAKKDVDDAIINSKFSAIEYQAEYEKSIKEMLSNKKMSKEEQTLFNQYLAMGGYSNTVFDKRTGFAKEPKAGGKVLAKIGDMNDFIEQIPRFTEFKLTLKHGGSLTEAMYNAAEVTTNFKRYGVLTKKMDKLATTFFSASMAGFYKQVRNLTQQPSGRAYARFAAKSLAIGLTPAIINGLMYANPFGDDDDKDEAAEAYKNLPQYVKDDYLVWYIGDGKFMRIPKGRAASIPGIVYNAAKSKVQKEEVSFGEMVNSVLNQVGPSNPLSSNAILQIWQSGLFDNKSQGTSWNGSKIESSYLHKKEVTERYDSKTDEISKAISKGVSKATGGKIKISPKKLNYTIDQNSGIIGDILLPIFTPKSTGPSTAARILNPITSKFTTDTVVSNKTSNKFYDKIDKYNEKADAETATRADLVKKSYLSSVSGEIADKRKQIEEIESSDLSKNEKYKQTRELQKEINNLQKKALEDENTYKKVGKEVSTIGDEVYYKSSYDGRTTWKKESDKTKAKRDELGLSVEKYYYYKKDEAFKKPDGKTTSIVDGKTAKDKIALVDAFGFDPSDYEKYSYEINQIKAGKDTQRQVTEYIESLPISATQKAALYKKKYKSYRNADRTIYNSIENSNLSKEEKESLAKFLKIK